MTRRPLIAAWTVALALAAAGAAQAQAVAQTGAVTAGGVTQAPTPTTTFVQSCNSGAGGIVGQAGCSLPTSAVAAATAPANFPTGQVSVTTAATLIVAARTGRATVTVENLGTTAVWVGPANTVTTTNGVLIPGAVGASITLTYTGAVYGIVGTGTQTVAEYETY